MDKHFRLQIINSFYVYSFTWRGRCCSAFRQSFVLMRIVKYHRGTALDVAWTNNVAMAHTIKQTLPTLVFNRVLAGGAVCDCCKMFCQRHRTGSGVWLLHSRAMWHAMQAPGLSLFVWDKIPSAIPDLTWQVGTRSIYPSIVVMKKHE